MDKVTVTRLLLAAAFLGAAVAWQLAEGLAQRVQRQPRWVRACDTLWFLTALWGMSVMLFAVWDHAGPLFVRDWLQFALPPVVLWPPVRRYVGVTKLLRGSHG